MKVWVVGGAGYIGSHVCKALRRAGHEVGVFDNLSTGRRENLSPETALTRGDVLDFESLRQAARHGYDGVIHLAALKAAGESMEFPERYCRNNISGAVNLLEAVLEAGIRAFVFSSSAAVYGEPAYLPLDEGHPARPENFYGHTKLVVEGLLEWYGRLKGLRSVSLRYFNAAGYDPDGEITGLERNPANLVPVVMETARGWRPKLGIFGNDYPTRDGTCIRDCVHVSDLADGHVKALEHLGRGGGSLTLNLGTGSGITVMEMIRKAGEATGKEIRFEIAGRRAGDPAAVVASSALAERELGWKPRFSDPETLLRTAWKAYQANAGKA